MPPRYRPVVLVRAAPLVVALLAGCTSANPPPPPPTAPSSLTTAPAATAVTRAPTALAGGQAAAAVFASGPRSTQLPVRVLRRPSPDLTATPLDPPLTRGESYLVELDTPTAGPLRLPSSLRGATVAYVGDDRLVERVVSDPADARPLDRPYRTALVAPPGTPFADELAPGDALRLTPLPGRSSVGQTLPVPPPGPPPAYPAPGG